MDDKSGFDFNAIAGHYERTAEPLTLPFGERALVLAGVGAGTGVIDAACGTGGVAVAAAGRGARVLAVDSTPAMVARAAERLRPFPACEARQMGCEALEAPDAVFDVALSLFGVMILPQWREGLAELARVTRRAGRVVVSAWADPEGPKTLMPLKAAFASAFPRRAFWPHEPVIWTEETIRDALEAAGCTEVSVLLQEGELVSRSMDQMMADSGPMFRFAPGFAALADDEREHVLADYRERQRRYTAPDGSVHLPMPAFVAEGVRA